jgi:hypothetical protein
MQNDVVELVDHFIIKDWDNDNKYKDLLNKTYNILMNKNYQLLDRIILFIHCIPKHESVCLHCLKIAIKNCNNDKGACQCRKNKKYLESNKIFTQQELGNLYESGWNTYSINIEELCKFVKNDEQAILYSIRYIIRSISQYQINNEPYKSFLSLSAKLVLECKKKEVTNYIFKDKNQGDRYEKLIPDILRQCDDINKTYRKFKPLCNKNSLFYHYLNEKLDRKQDISKFYSKIAVSNDIWAKLDPPPKDYFHSLPPQKLAHFLTNNKTAKTGLTQDEIKMALFPLFDDENYKEKLKFLFGSGPNFNKIAQDLINEPDCLHWKLTRFREIPLGLVVEYFKEISKDSKENIIKFIEFMYNNVPDKAKKHMIEVFNDM